MLSTILEQPHQTFQLGKHKEKVVHPKLTNITRFSNAAKNILHKTNSQSSSTSNYTILNDKACTGSDVDVLIWVYSKPNNFLRRSAVRQQWGKVELYKPIKVAVIFLLAAVIDKTVQTQIMEEQAAQGDLIQDGSFIDSYRNLSYKVCYIFLFKKAAVHCNKSLKNEPSHKALCAK